MYTSTVYGCGTYSTPKRAKCKTTSAHYVLLNVVHFCRIEGAVILLVDTSIPKKLSRALWFTNATQIITSRDDAFLKRCVFFSSRCRNTFRGNICLKMGNFHLRRRDVEEHTIGSSQRSPEEMVAYFAIKAQGSSLTSLALLVNKNVFSLNSKVQNQIISISHGALKCIAWAQTTPPSPVSFRIS